MKRFRDLLERIPPAKVEALEVREAILDEIEEELVETLDDGRRRLHNHIRITLLSPESERRIRLRRAFSAGGGLKQRIVSRCSGQNVEVPASLTVEIEDGAPADPTCPNEFRTEGWTDAPPPAEVRRVASARLTVLTTGQVFQISSSVFRIGREKETKDRSDRPKPENHLHFGEKELSVSRQHAHICFDQSTDEYRLWDLGSTQGTRIVREGAEIDVPKSPRAPGQRLRQGDLIYFGKVGVKFHLASTSTKVRKAAATTSSTVKSR